MKTKHYIAALCVCLATLAAFSFILNFWNRAPEGSVLKVGFIYAEDESTPYTANFIRAQTELEKALGSRIQTFVRSNVPGKEMTEPLWELLQRGCGIIFTNVNSNQVGEVAEQFPEAQVCQVSAADMEQTVTPANYHTFNGAAYEGSYISGVAAGMKLRQLLDSGSITPAEALIGYVGSQKNTETISGFTAYLLGARTVAPEAVMRVCYTGAGSSYSREKEAAEKLLKENCVIIAQGTSTIGPVIACQEAAHTREVWHTGVHESMTDLAPNVSLTGYRINWAPYVLGAVRAVMNRRSIESTVEGRAFGQDMCAGFERGWVEMLEVNRMTAADGTEEKINNLVDSLRAGKTQVFQGNYTGVDPDNPEDTIDLRTGYLENQDSSVAGFHYILKNCITIETDNTDSESSQE